MSYYSYNCIILKFIFIFVFCFVFCLCLYRSCRYCYCNFHDSDTCISVNEIFQLFKYDLEITVLYLKISRHQFEIWWLQIEFTGDVLAEPVNRYLRPLYQQLIPWQIEFTGDVLAEPVNRYLRPLNRLLMPWYFQIQYSYLHSNYVIMCIDVDCHSIDKMT